MYDFFSGVAAAGCLTVACFFLRFWNRTRDELLLIFSAAFAVFSITPILSGLFHISEQEQVWAYVPRLGGFILIAGGILWANLRRPRL
jgi:Family of unknown function (DUF5985)